MHLLDQCRTIQLPRVPDARGSLSFFEGGRHVAWASFDEGLTKKQVDTLTSGFDPMETVRREIETAVEDKPPSALATSESAPGNVAAAPADAPSAYAPGASDTSPATPAQPAGAEGDKALAEAGDAKPGDRPA